MGGYGGPAGEWEAVQRRQRLLAAQGRYVELGRDEARRLEQEEAERRAEGLRVEGVRREYGRLQAEADRVGAGMTRDQLDRINEKWRRRVESMPAGVRSFSTEASAWLLEAQSEQEEAARERGAAQRAAADADRGPDRGPDRDADRGGYAVRDGKRVIDDGDVRDMSVEDYQRIFDPRTSLPKPDSGFFYEPGGGSLESALLSNANALSSGLGSGRTDVS